MTEPATFHVPCDIETERAILGTLMIDNNAFKHAIDLRLKEDYFSAPAHAQIFAAALELNSRRDLANPVTLKNLLEERGQLDAVGGPRYLAQIAASAPSASGLRGRILRLQDLYLRRILLAEAQRMIERVSTTEGDETGFEALCATVGRLQELRHRVAKFIGGF